MCALHSAPGLINSVCRSVEQLSHMSLILQQSRSLHCVNPAAQKDTRGSQVVTHLVVTRSAQFCPYWAGTWQQDGRSGAKTSVGTPTGLSSRPLSQPFPDGVTRRSPDCSACMHTTNAHANNGFACHAVPRATPALLEGPDLLHPTGCHLTSRGGPPGHRPV